MFGNSLYSWHISDLSTIRRKKKFNFVLNYGVEEEINLILFNYNRKPKNSLNTLRGIFTKDLVLNGKAKTKLTLTEAEMKEIENYIAKNNIMDYPDEITVEIILNYISRWQEEINSVE